MLVRWLLLLPPLLILIFLSTAAGVVHAGAPSAPVNTSGLPAGSDLIYSVKANDTLWEIATAHKTSVEALIAANRGINPKRLLAGQKLRIPGAGPAPAANAYVANQTPTPTYTVRAGDTLWDIASRHGVFVNDVIAANPGVNPKRLIAGQNLAIPGAGGIPASPRQVSATYSVRAEDTLWEIAANYGLTVDTVLAANPGVDPRRLIIGQSLQIPGIVQEALSAVVTPSAPAAPPPASPEGTAPAEGAPAEGAPAPDPNTPPAAAQDPQTPPATNEATSLTPELATWVQDMLNRINEKRAAGGRAALAWNNELALAAQRHAEDCASRNRGSHVGSDGARLRTRMERANYGPITWSGENWANARSVGRAFDLWWNEPPGANPHVLNIMESRATEIGIGVARGAWGYYFIADFGSR